MLITMNRIAVNPEYATAFEENFRNRAGLVDRMPGFVANQLLRPVNPGDPYVVLTTWESRAHFEAWVRSEEFVQGHARSGSLPAETFSGPSKLEMFVILTDTSRPELEAEAPGTPFRPHS